MDAIQALNYLLIAQGSYKLHILKRQIPGIQKSDEVKSRFGAGIKTSQEHARQTRMMNARMRPMMTSLLGFMAASQKFIFLIGDGVKSGCQIGTLNQFNRSEGYPSPTF